ncbi:MULTISPECIES: DivIVA domain-containing protein [Protofrankia]|uniref:Cell division protein DivIVA n=1 Tax=Protofrankia coriariae TaxID=1562887 RepID=A0ABR5F8J4_9ACTN|nr:MULTISPECIES: DivIVA domain-containing protein [Protofrankia]KLL13041.1 cell division protein DivIVA [Protofrankia coriariae]ONH38017.1 cell division protein DivIVA [Protofrankia sp. BMG5.30]
MLLAVEIVVVAAIVFAVAALAVGRFDRLSPAPRDAADQRLPSPTVSADDVAGIRFEMALRGYRMADVDAVLARLADELAWRDAELARRDEEMVRLASFARLDRYPWSARGTGQGGWRGQAEGPDTADTHQPTDTAGTRRPSNTPDSPHSSLPAPPSG